MPLLNDVEKLRIYLGLPEAPKYITKVTVPRKTDLNVGHIGAQPNFGLMEFSGFQYQLKELLLKSNFTNTELIEEFIKKISKEK